MTAWKLYFYCAWNPFFYRDNNSNDNSPGSFQSRELRAKKTRTLIQLLCYGVIK